MHKMNPLHLEEETKLDKLESIEDQGVSDSNSPQPEEPMHSRPDDGGSDSTARIQRYGASLMHRNAIATRPIDKKLKDAGIIVFVVLITFLGGAAVLTFMALITVLFVLLCDALFKAIHGSDHLD
jgi:hypothetical protein